MAIATSRYAIPDSGGELARRTAGGVLVAVVAALVVRLLVGSLGLAVGPTGPMTPFGTVPIVMSAVVAGIGAAVVYAALVRFTRRPVRNFLVASAVVFGLMLVPVVAAAPGMGVTAVGQGVLVVLHAVVAVPLVAFAVGAVRL